MESLELTKSLTQVLENFQRCGLRRVQRGAASEALLDAVDRVMGASEEAPSAASAPAVSESQQVAAPAPSAKVETKAPPATPKQWSLPVLEDAERERRLTALSAEVKQCRSCTEIVNFRQQTVFGCGPVRPKICFMGEAPGADEDRQGEPFVGRAGQLLTKIIGAMQLKREEVFILNALKCRPPQNRTPVPEEIDHCRGYVESQLEVLQPEYLVCLGAVAVQSLLQTKQPVGRLRGRFHEYRGAKVVVTYHPSYLLRNADAKRFVWDDMKMLMKDIGVAL